MFIKKEVGNLGELIVCDYLIKKGWIIYGRNIKRRGDEVDIVVKSDEGILVFVEVKTMIFDPEIPMKFRLKPEDNMTKFKIIRFERICEFLVRKYPTWIDEEKGWRMDLVAVEISPGGTVVAMRHYENIS